MITTTKLIYQSSLTLTWYSVSFKKGSNSIYRKWPRKLKAVVHASKIQVMNLARKDLIRCKRSWPSPRKWRRVAAICRLRLEFSCLKDYASRKRKRCSAIRLKISRSTSSWIRLMCLESRRTSPCLLGIALETMTPMVLQMNWTRTWRSASRTA